jgi:hypothetical protein
MEADNGWEENFHFLHLASGKLKTTPEGIDCRLAGFS